MPGGQATVGGAPFVQTDIDGFAGAKWLRRRASRFSGCLRLRPVATGTRRQKNRPAGLALTPKHASAVRKRRQGLCLGAGGDTGVEGGIGWHAGHHCAIGRNKVALCRGLRFVTGHRVAWLRETRRC